MLSIKYILYSIFILNLIDIISYSEGTVPCYLYNVQYIEYIYSIWLIASHILKEQYHVIYMIGSATVHPITFHPRMFHPITFHPNHVSPNHVSPKLHFTQSTFHPKHISPKSRFTQITFHPKHVSPKPRFTQITFHPKHVSPNHTCLIFSPKKFF